MRNIGISYSRLSDPKQAKGDSQDRQDRMYRNFCKRHDLTPLAEVFADKGRSGYKDEHRKKGRLGVLVAMAKDGRFDPGTVIVVEAWDRLGRLRPDKQTDLIAELLRTGVNIGICRLDDIFKEDDFGTHKWTTLAVFIQLAYQESKQKAERVGESWKKRRELARDEGRLMTRRLPAWLEEVNGQTLPIPQAVAALKRIFALSSDGFGRARIVRTLMSEKVPPLGDSKDWTRPYVNKLLNDRRVLGEYQPRLTDDTPDGSVILGYYPEVISEEEYQLARRGQEGRRGISGPNSRLVDGPTTSTDRERRATSIRGPKDNRYVNVFQSLLHHARDGGGFVLANRGTTIDPKLVLVNAAGMGGQSMRTYTFPYPVFEKAILSQLREIDPKDVLPKVAGAELSKVDVLRAKLQNVHEQVRQLKADLKTGYSKGLADILRDQEAAEEQTAGQLQEELSKSIKPVEKAWAELRQLVDLVEDGGDPARLKVRSELRQVCEGIWLVTARKGRVILCNAQVWFKGGESYRSYIIVYRQAGRGVAGRWFALSIKHPDDGLDMIENYDLRNRDEVEGTKGFLENYPLDMIERLLAKGQPLP
jgi:DNA invertase Pin-like site-specific DNA recombinase